MNKQRKRISFVLILIIVFSTSIIYLPTNNKFLFSKQVDSINQTEEEIFDDESNCIECLKSADISEEQQNHNFSFNTLIKESWNQTFAFYELNSTKPDNSQTDRMILQNINISSMTFQFYMLNLINLSSGQSVMPSNFTTMKLSYYNETHEMEDIGEITDVSQPNPDGINGTLIGFVNINETSDAQFVVWNDWDEDTNISYNAYIFIQANREYKLNTRFVPTEENTQSNMITWELNYEGHHNQITSNQFYNASLKIEELNNFTIRNALGYDGDYWIPLDYSRNNTHIFINESYAQYKIELQTPNYLSVVFNNNLSSDKNELKLYATCKIAGNLSVQFRLTNGTILRKSWLVQENDTIFYNYIMPHNSTGGIGYLNITLTDNSKTHFGVKIHEVAFYKKTEFWVDTSETTGAFSQFFIAGAYIDMDNLWYYLALNESSSSFNINETQLHELILIPNANVTYELEDLKGELDFKFLGGFFQAPNITFYWKIVDLSEYQIPPGSYNITFTASKPGYGSLVKVQPFNITKKAVFIDIVSIEDVFVIDESFAITINLYDNVTFQNFLMVPVMLNLTFTNNDTKEVDLEFQWPGPVIQAITIQGFIENDTLPGTYILDILIDSEYYYGNASYIVEVVKKKLEMSLNYDSKVDEDEKFDIVWSLESGNFTGNRENMTLEIYVDGILHRVVNLTSTNSSSGVITLELDKGDHLITYRLISPFYEAERIIEIEAEKESSKPKEKSWIEENWLWLLILIALILAMSLFGIYMTISRRKVKAQRELDSELVALKTRVLSTEENVSLIATQISQIAGIYWILIIHSEQGTAMVEIDGFRFKEVLGEDYEEIVDKGLIRDSALIGGFLTAIRNFSRETSGTLHEYQPIFNSQTDYSTVINDNEVHRRILEGTDYFMAFISSTGTLEISDVLSSVNSKFHDGYSEAVKSFMGKITVFFPFKEEVVSYLHNDIRELQKKLEDEKLMLEHYQRHLKQVQEKIGIKKNK